MAEQAESIGSSTYVYMSHAIYEFVISYSEPLLYSQSVMGHMFGCVTLPSLYIGDQFAAYHVYGSKSFPNPLQGVRP